MKIFSIDNLVRGKKMAKVKYMARTTVNVEIRIVKEGPYHYVDFRFGTDEWVSIGGCFRDYESAREFGANWRNYLYECAGSERR